MDRAQAMKPNRMKAKLLAGEPTFGVSMMIPSCQIVEMLGRLGFDWILIDREHGAIDLETVELLSMAADAAGLTSIARPRTKRPEEILAVMDRGVHGVQVPHVNTAEEARQVVAAVKYHPLGSRGMAAGTRPADYGFGATPAEYVEAANRETLVCVQLEEETAIQNAEEILAVDQVDVFFVGPADLSQSMGHPGNPQAPAVRAAIDGTFRKIAAAGKIAGTSAGASAIRQTLERGVLYTYTHVTDLLGTAAGAFFEAARSR